MEAAGHAAPTEQKQTSVGAHLASPVLLSSGPLQMGWCHHIQGANSQFNLSRNTLRDIPGGVSSQIDNEDYHLMGLVLLTQAVR